MWDYPRPPALRETSALVEVIGPDGEPLAATTKALLLLETSHPPCYYLPMDDVRMERLQRSKLALTVCEYKGVAMYWDFVLGDLAVTRVAWSYPKPPAEYALLADRIAFYPNRVHRCLVAGEPVTPQAGGLYGGWITKDVVGPFKGAVGTELW